MRKKLSILIISSLLILSMLSVFTFVPKGVLGLTSDYDPNGEGHELDWTPKNAGDHYVEVDDGNGTHDDDTTWLSVTSGNQEDYWLLEDPGESGVISNVRLSLRVKHSAGGEEFAFCLSNGTTEWVGSDVATDTTWTTYILDHATNPITTGDWYFGDIALLQLGIKSRAIGGYTGTGYVTSGWITVTYTEPVVPGTITWDAAANGNWDDTANWDLARVPVDGDDVVFDTTSTYNCNVDVTTANLDSFLMDTGYTGTVDLNSYTLNVEYTADGSDFTGTQGTFDADTGTVEVSGNWDSSSATFTFTRGTSTVDLTGTGTMTTRDVTTNAYYHIKVGAAGKITSMGSHIGTYGSFTVGAGTIQVSFFVYMYHANLVNDGTMNAGVIWYQPGDTDFTVVSTTYGRSLQVRPNDGYKGTLGGDISVGLGLHVSTPPGIGGIGGLDTANYDITSANKIEVGHTGAAPSRAGYLKCGSSTIDISKTGGGDSVFIYRPESYIIGDTSTWTLEGHWTSESTSASWDEGTMDITFDGTTQSVDNNELDFYDVTIGATSTTTFTDGFDIGGNLTVNGIMKAGSIYIDATTGQFDFYIPNPGQAWLNDTTVNDTDLNEYLGGFNYSIGSGKNTTLNEFTIENAATDSSHNFTAVDFSAKGSGIVAHWNTTAYTGSERIKFLVGNLTASEEYKVYIDSVLANTTTADGSGDIFFSNNSLTHNYIYLTWSPGVTPASLTVTLRKSDNTQERIDVGYWGNMTLTPGATLQNSTNFVRAQCDDCDGVDDSFWVNWSGTTWDSTDTGDTIAIDGNYRLWYYETTSGSADPDDGGWVWSDSGVDADGDYQITFENSGTTYVWVRYRIEAVPSPLSGCDDLKQDYTVELDR